MPLILLAAAAFVFYQLKGTNDLYNKLSYEVAALRLDQKGLNVFSTKLILDLLINNPTGATVTIKGIEGNILASGQVIGTYSIKTPFTINARSSIKVPITIQAQNYTLILSLINQVKNRVIPEIKLNGTLFTSVGSFNFDNKLIDKKAIQI